MMFHPLNEGRPHSVDLLRAERPNSEAGADAFGAGGGSGHAGPGSAIQRGVCGFGPRQRARSAPPADLEV